MDEIELLSGWKEICLGDLANVKGGKRLPKGHDFSNIITPFPYIRVVDLDNYSVKFSNLQYLKAEDREIIKNYIINTEDVYISIAGTIGRVGIIPQILDKANLTENAARIIINDHKILDKYYLAFYLTSKKGKNEVNRRTTKTSQPKLAIARIKQIPILVPPLPEQKSIAHTLRTIQKAKETRQRELELERERKAALMEYLFTHGTRNEARKQTEIGEIPESWDIYKLRNICIKQPQNGAFIKKPQWGKGTLFVNVVDTYRSAIVNFNYVERLICTEEDISRFSLQNGDLLFVRSSLKREGIAQCCLIESLHEPAIFDCHLIRVIPDQSISDNYYLTCYFLSERARNDLIARSKMTTMTTINQNNLIDSLVPIPSLPEQKEIAHILKSCDTKIQALEKEISLTDELFHATLEELMTGKLSTKNLIAQ
ncbi:restriction endonuclease subunit S [Cuspidothrix issatschenkoi]|uniref:Type I restriction modification DNA specificity domain-containing protein n=1 Tax=Cuspidothrix issatschenkoi CHARLIE-1 TaxID=2052836 RepID=A0A2S6CZP1_9CYAN|nr:restriction endonuclease subunit S [Cuspidothrix issatschenkoi]PPJ65223.1 hypothetical protein CUN59_00190 [Cuspidothrix issatschenkoi CHARLIE-1]